MTATLERLQGKKPKKAQKRPEKSDVGTAAEGDDDDGAGVGKSGAQRSNGLIGELQGVAMKTFQSLGDAPGVKHIVGGVTTMLGFLYREVVPFPVQREATAGWPTLRRIPGDLCDQIVPGNK